MMRPVLSSNYPAFLDPNEDITFGEYEEFLLEQPNQLYERGRSPIKKGGNFLLVDPEQVLPFHILGWDAPENPPMKCGVIHLFIHYLFYSLSDLIGAEKAIEKFRLLKNYLDFWGDFKNKSLPMMEFYLIIGGKGGLFAYFFEDKMGFGEEEFMQKNPYCKKQLLEPHIRISLENWRIGMYGEETMEKLKKDHLENWERGPRDQLIHDLDTAMKTVSSGKFKINFVNQKPQYANLEFTDKDMGQFNKMQEFVDGYGGVYIQQHKGIPAAIKGEKTYKYKEDGNGNKDN